MVISNFVEGQKATFVSMTEVKTMQHALIKIKADQLRYKSLKTR